MSQRVTDATGWHTLKIRNWQYEALAQCSLATGRSILKLAEEGLKVYIEDVLPIYIDGAARDQEKIRTKRGEDTARKRGRPVKNAPKKTQKGPFETVANTP